MYMTPNGMIVLDEKEKKAARMVQGKNVCSCEHCTCDKEKEGKKEDQK
jgi:hypothetical protein